MRQRIAERVIAQARHAIAQLDAEFSHA